jgi:hypothetical protein
MAMKVEQGFRKEWPGKNRCSRFKRLLQGAIAAGCWAMRTSEL